MKKLISFIKHFIWCFSTEASMASEEDINDIAINCINESKRNNGKS